MALLIALCMLILVLESCQLSHQSCSSQACVSKGFTASWRGGQDCLQSGCMGQRMDTRHWTSSDLLLQFLVLLFEPFDILMILLLAPLVVFCRTGKVVHFRLQSPVSRDRKPTIGSTDRPFETILRAGSEINAVYTTRE